MGVDVSIHVWNIESKQRIDWNFITWENQNYRFFGWLSGIRNYSDVIPLKKSKGTMPKWIVEKNKHFYCEDNDTAFVYITLDEFLSIDYEQIVEDRRVHAGVRGDVTCNEGEGEFMTLVDFLGQEWMEELEALSNIGNIGFVFIFLL